MEKRLLAVHSVWDYFRSKLVLRQQEPFATFLKAADAFAWACYLPVLEHLSDPQGPLRQPPLVALQGGVVAVRDPSRSPVPGNALARRLDRQCPVRCSDLGAAGPDLLACRGSIWSISHTP